MKQNPPKERIPDASKLLKQFNEKFVFRLENQPNIPESVEREVYPMDNNPFVTQPCMSPETMIPKQKPRMELEEGCPNFGGGEKQVPLEERIVPKYRDAEEFYEPIVNDLVEPEPPPVINNLPFIWELVMQDMKDRHEFGMKKYGTGLQAFNGRNPRKDAYQEKLDDLVYTRQQIFEDEYKDAVVDAAIQIVEQLRSQTLDVNVQVLVSAVDSLLTIRGEK